MKANYIVRFHGKQIKARFQDRNGGTNMRIWYLMCGLTQEYAVVFATSKEEAFEKLKDEETYVIIDANRSPEEIAADVWEAVKTYVGKQ